MGPSRPRKLGRTPSEVQSDRQLLLNLGKLPPKLFVFRLKSLDFVLQVFNLDCDGRK
jgi:hypothetical protein